MWAGGHRGEPELLRRCYANALHLAGEHNIRSIAFPSISTGVYGYPIEQAAAVAVQTVREVLPSTPSMELVRFVCFSAPDLAVYRRLLDG